MTGKEKIEIHAGDVGTMEGEGIAGEIKIAGMIPHRLYIASSKVEKGNRTQVVHGARSSEIYIKTKLADRTIVAQLSVTLVPQEPDLTNEEIVGAAAMIYKLKDGFPCVVHILERMNMIPILVRRGGCHYGPGIEKAKPSRAEKVGLVNAVEAGTVITGPGVEKVDDKTVNVRTHTVEFINDTQATLVAPLGDNRTFTAEDDLWKEAGLPKIDPVTKAEIEAKNP